MARKQVYFVTAAALVFVLLIACGPPPAPPVESAADRAASLRREAEAAAETGNINQALECVGKALAATPEDTELIVLKGMYLSRVGRFQDAITAYNRAFLLTRDPALAFTIAEHLVIMGRYLDAESYAYFTVKEQPAYVPGLALLTEVEMALWQLENAGKCIVSLKKLNVDTRRHAEELKRRTAVFGRESMAELGGIKNHMYLKSGTIITGIADDEGTAGDESVFAALDEKGIGEMIGRAAVLCKHYKKLPDIVLAAGEELEAAEFLAGVLAETCGAVKGDLPLQGLQGKNVWICAVNYKPGAASKAAAAIREAGGRPYVFCAGIARGSIRECRLSPDIAGLGGLVMVSADSLDRDEVLKVAATFIETEGPAFMKAQALFYSGTKSLLTLTADR